MDTKPTLRCELIIYFNVELQFSTMADEPKAETKKFKGVYWGSSVAAPGESPSDGIMRVRLWLAHLSGSLLCSVAMKNGDISFFYKKR